MYSAFIQGNFVNGIPAMLSSQAPLYLPEDLKAEISDEGRISQISFRDRHS